MKKMFFLCLMALPCSCYAQYSLYDSAIQFRISPSFFTAIDTLIAQAASDPSDTGESSNSNALLRYKYFMGSRISLDVAPGADMTAPMAMALNSYRSFFADYCPGSGYTGDWHCIGPFNNYYGNNAFIGGNPEEKQGRINSIWVNTVSGTILAGADGGGLWKSTNNGHSWHNITDGSGSNSGHWRES